MLPSLKGNHLVVLFLSVGIGLTNCKGSDASKPALDSGSADRAADSRANGSGGIQGSGGASANTTVPNLGQGGSGSASSGSGGWPSGAGGAGADSDAKPLDPPDAAMSGTGGRATGDGPSAAGTSGSSIDGAADRPQDVNVVSSCGRLGTACCPNPDGGAAWCTDPGSICSGTLCVACGTPGSPCCAQDQCASPACCDNHLCIAEKTACATAGGTCLAGRCSACGRTGETCCSADAGSPGCQNGAVCIDAGTAMCSRCGQLNDPCCANDVCSVGCCSAGRCLSRPGCSTPIAICGNGLLEAQEICDDGNTVPGDGCSGDCLKIEDGWQCRVPGGRCSPLCGDGRLMGSETCDDGNGTSGDGCSSTCQVEPGANCATIGKPCTFHVCGNGKLESGELCDCGLDSAALPAGCHGINGLFWGDGTGCSKTCTKEPTCLDSTGKTQACTTACGDGNIDPDEQCDDGNLVSGDGCSSACKVETGFVCSTVTVPVTSRCLSGSGDCLELPMILRDFQPENVDVGGHPDFFFLGTHYNGSGSPTTICVPNSAGPSKGNDSTSRCWGIAAGTLLNGKPQAGSSTTCTCQFTDTNVANASHIPGGYTQAGNDSPLSDGHGNFLGGTAGSTVSTTSTAGTFSGTLTGYTAAGGPIFKGVVPAYKNANSFKQWFSDDTSVNKTYLSVLEMPAIGTNVYQYASRVHLADGGFFPLDVLNPSQATLCNLWPYWNRGTGSAMWSTCKGDQYYTSPYVVQSDCANPSTYSSGCWVTAVQGAKHDSYFTEQLIHHFVYDGVMGLQLSFYGDDDLFVFVNGIEVLDLGGVHQLLPGRVTITGSPGDATVTEGGCLDAAGNIVGTSAGSTACAPSGSTAPSAATPDDFRVRTVKLGLQTGKVYELAIFGADRHPPASNFQITLSGAAAKQSRCTPRCGDGIVTAGEACDCGDGTAPVPSGCPGPNDDARYGGCSTQCQLGPYCGDGMVNPTEACDMGKDNGMSGSGCSAGCRIVL